MPADTTLARVAEAIKAAMGDSGVNPHCICPDCERFWRDAPPAALAAARGEVDAEIRRRVEAMESWPEESWRQLLIVFDSAEYTATDRCAALLRALGVGAATDRGADAKGGEG